MSLYIYYILFDAMPFMLELHRVHVPCRKFILSVILNKLCYVIGICSKDSVIVFYSRCPQIIFKSVFNLWHTWHSMVQILLYVLPMFTIRFLLFIDQTRCGVTRRFVYERARNLLCEYRWPWFVYTPYYVNTRTYVIIAFSLR